MCYSLPAKKWDFAVANRYYLSHECEETMDHLLHYEKMKLLREILFSLFGISWMN